MTQSERFDGEYGPSTWAWVREQADAYEASNGSEANTLRDTGLPIIVMTTVGHRCPLAARNGSRSTGTAPKCVTTLDETKVRCAPVSTSASKNRGLALPWADTFTTALRRIRSMPQHC